MPLPKGMLLGSSLVPRPLPDFISQPWRKIGRRPGIKLRHGPEMVDSVSTNRGRHGPEMVDLVSM